ncbi:MAG: Gfo/Idh/MocA family protein [Candidatus Latescibacterota bacterium]
MSTKDFSRRTFIGTAMAAGALAVACGQAKSKATAAVMLDTAPDGAELKAGLVGCGGRGKGAAMNFINAGPNLKITAVGDVFPDRVQEAVTMIKEKGNQDVAPENCFTGFDAFKNVIDSGVDIVILATPPHFRPEHFAAAVAAGKHVFMEKPVAVDPAGIRSILESAGQAKTRNLNVVTGTQRHHQRCYVEILRRVQEGAIGDIVAARAYWNQNKLWHRDRDPKWSDMEWMIRDWVNWRWLSGDHIVEQHVHNLDVIHWFTGKYPVKAVGMGGRARRVTGDQFDCFSVDYEFENGMHMLSMCRQINDCANNVSEFLVGTKGSTNCANTIYGPDGKIVFKIEVKNKEEQAKDAAEKKEKPAYEVMTIEKDSPYDQEHIDLVTAIRQGKVINEAEAIANSCLVAIMGRESAYTGAETSWKEMMDSPMRLGPTEYALGKADLTAVIPVAGKAFEPKKA